MVHRRLSEFVGRLTGLQLPPLSPSLQAILSCDRLDPFAHVARGRAGDSSAAAGNYRAHPRSVVTNQESVCVEALADNALVNEIKSLIQAQKLWVFWWQPIDSHPTTPPRLLFSKDHRLRAADASNA